MERGTGLIHFIESYRKLTRLSKPIFKSVVLKDMIEHLLVLMEYAVEHTATPKIDITANCTDIGYLEVRVTDNGAGIPFEIMDHIFIPFFTTKENGSGIGLSLSRQIMRNHGGSIEVVSSPGNTQFTLKLIK